MSLGVHRVVAGMGMTPNFIIPTIATYHSGIRGSMMNTRSPLDTPMLFSTLANLLDWTFRSQKLCCSACSPVGSTEIKASFVRSSAQRSTTSKPKL